MIEGDVLLSKRLGTLYILARPGANRPWPFKKIISTRGLTSTNGKRYIVQHNSNSLKDLQCIILKNYEQTCAETASLPLLSAIAVFGFWRLTVDQGCQLADPLTQMGNEIKPVKAKILYEFIENKNKINPP